MLQLRLDRMLQGAALGAFALVLSGAQSLQAQSTPITACYIPVVGVIYMVGESGLPSECLNDQHVEISWPTAAGGDGGTVTSVAAGDGLLGGTITESGTISVDFAGSGSATTVARSDHTHEGSGEGSVASVTAGAGLLGGTITESGTISVDFDGPGSAETVARSDHTHNVGGTGNVGVGNGVMFNNTTGTQNTALGSNALRNSGTGVENVVVGAGSMDFNAGTAGSYNTVLGSFALRRATGDNNIAVGNRAMEFATTAQNNLAVGRFALRDNATGFTNTAVGHSALAANTSQDNTAIGNAAMENGMTGSHNTAVGAFSLRQAGGSFNSTLGWGAALNTTANANVALGYLALYDNTTGARNIAIGREAGRNATTGSDNIFIGNQGVAGEANTIRIGTAATHDRAFIAGIRGVTTGANNAVAVVIDSNGQLGTMSSSVRFKDDIEDMGDASRRIMDLHPVMFRYVEPTRTGDRPLQYGLIAEEVEQVFPALVAHGADGKPETVKYHILPSLLLNEVQRQQREITALEHELAALRAIVEELRGARRASPGSTPAF